LGTPRRKGKLPQLFTPLGEKDERTGDDDEDKQRPPKGFGRAFGESEMDASEHDDPSCFEDAEGASLEPCLSGHGSRCAHRATIKRPNRRFNEAWRRSPRTASMQMHVWYNLLIVGITGENRA